MNFLELLNRKFRRSQILWEPFFIKYEVVEWIQGLQIKCEEISLEKLQNFDLFVAA